MIDLTLDIPTTDLRGILPWEPSRALPLWDAAPAFATLHYRGATFPVAPNLTRDQQIAILWDEAKYHRDKDWSITPGVVVLGDGIMYHYAILSSGEICQLVDPRTRYHCANGLGNRRSIAIHLPIGGSQDATDAQWSALGRLLASIGRKWPQIDRDSWIGHCEWPPSTSERPRKIATYGARNPVQSECPGPVLFGRLLGLRAQPPADPWAAWGTAFALPVEQRGYGIPQCWLTQRGTLGQARSQEQVLAGPIIGRGFQGGLVCYDSRDPQRGAWVAELWARWTP